MNPAPFTLRRMSEVRPVDLVALHNHPLVRRTLPLAVSFMDESGAQRMLAAKDRLWTEHGHGPWAVFVGERFAGWGGLQAEGADADLALVLHPDCWGLGPGIVRVLLRQAFERWELPSVTVLLPPGRRGSRALARLRFISDGEGVVGGLIFARHRLCAPAWRAHSASSSV